MKQEMSDSLVDSNDSQPVTCYVNAVSADDEEKYPVGELKQQLKERVERYTAIQRNVLYMLHIIIPDLNIAKCHPSTMSSSNLSIYAPARVVRTNKHIDGGMSACPH